MRLRCYQRLFPGRLTGCQADCRPTLVIRSSDNEPAEAAGIPPIPLFGEATRRPGLSRLLTLGFVGCQMSGGRRSRAGSLDADTPCPSVSRAHAALWRQKPGRSSEWAHGAKAQPIRRTRRPDFAAARASCDLSFGGRTWMLPVWGAGPCRRARAKYRTPGPQALLGSTGTARGDARPDGRKCPASWKNRGGIRASGDP